MLSNERFALDCRAYYDEIGLVVDGRNGEFAHSPLPRKEGDTGYYLLWEHHQQQGLLQSRDLGKCCFFSGDVKRWLLTCGYFPDDFFGLWDIYDEFVLTAMQTPEATKKRIETRRKNGNLLKGLNTPEARKRQVESRRRNNSYGDNKHMITPEAIKKALETKRKNGTLTRSPETIKKGIETKRKNGTLLKGLNTLETLKKKRQQVEITFPDGKVGIYHSATFAALALGVTDICVRRWARKGRAVTTGPYKGYFTLYL
jgi:hypothetical protein